MDIKINDTNRSCFNCHLRDGRYCEEFDMELKLADVKDNILQFDVLRCEMHKYRYNPND